MSRGSKVAALVVGAAVSATVMAAPAYAESNSSPHSAATSTTVRTSGHCWLKITGDGVRLRSKPVSGTVLGLQYRGDRIDPWTTSSSGWQYGYSTRLHRWGWVYSAYTLGYCD